MTSLAVGFGLGFFVGAQPGPVSLLCIRSVLRGALASGIAIGAGAAVIDLLYAGAFLLPPCLGCTCRAFGLCCVLLLVSGRCSVAFLYCSASFTLYNYF